MYSLAGLFIPRKLYVCLHVFQNSQVECFPLRTGRVFSHNYLYKALAYFFATVVASLFLSQCLLLADKLHSLVLGR